MRHRIYFIGFLFLLKQKKGAKQINYNYQKFPSHKNQASLMLNTLSKIEQLSPQAVPQLIRGDAQEESIIVQVLNIKKKPNGKFLCTLSDGNFYINSFVDQDMPIKEGDENSIICIKSHVALSSNVGVAKMIMIGKYPQRIGEPKDWKSHKQNQELISNCQALRYKLNKLSLAENLKTMPKQQIKIQKTETKKVNEEKVSSYESIDNLYITLKRWTLLCRVARKTLKQTPKKGIKVLQLELIDQSKKKIIGTFFNQTAVQFDEYLKQGSVYQISKGRIKQGNYNNSRNENYSPYTLIFDSKSIFTEISDFHIIVKNEDTAITLGAVYEKYVLQQEFDVVAYVVQIKQENVFQIGDKQKRVRELVLADPQAKITMSAKLWRWNDQVNPNWVGKVIIFSRFSLRQSQNTVYLCNGSSSSILTTHDHPMKKYEGKSIDISTYKETSGTYEGNVKKEQEPTEFCKNIKELQRKIQTLYQNESLTSIVNVWINRFAFNRKWCYQACPKCNKAAEKHSKCSNCGNTIDQTLLKFVLGIQISDCCGGLWITAYDSFGKKIFADLGTNPAAKLLTLEKDQLSDIQQKYLYQAFRLKIYTKKDVEGRIKHQAGHLYEMHEQKLAQENLSQISELMRY